jgi:RNA polymerase sigma-70 factor, ECF subfamily
MTMAASEITGLLRAWRNGDEAALARLTPLVYDHLRQIGQQYLRKERPEVRADATSLVHDAFLRLLDARTVNWQDRTHFWAVASTTMRRILVDAARARAAVKRGGELQRVDATTRELDQLPDVRVNRAEEICALDDALEALARHDSRRARVIELRFFGGLSVEETAETLGVSTQTVLRDWRLARAWLATEIRRPEPPAA